MAETTPDTAGTGASISATELAEMEVDAARGDLKAFDGIRLLAEVRRLNQEAMRLQNAVDLERRLKVAARKDADEVRAEVRHNLDNPWPRPTP